MIVAKCHCNHNRPIIPNGNFIYASFTLQLLLQNYEHPSGAPKMPPKWFETGSNVPILPPFASSFPPTAPEMLPDRYIPPDP